MTITEALVPPPSLLPADKLNDAARELAASIQGRGAAGLAWALSTWTGPASLLFAWVVSRSDQPGKVTVSVGSSVERALTPKECAFLGAPARTWAEHRHGKLRAQGDRIGLVADIESVVILARLPVGAEKSLKGDVPLGLIVAGCRREPLGAEPHMGGTASTARLWYGEWPLADVHEHVYPTACAHLAKPAGALDHLADM